MDMYEQAIENYLAAQMADAIRNGRMQDGLMDGGQQQGGGGPQMGDDELTRMLQALRDLGETGARDQARQLLNDMQKLLDKMQNMTIQRSQGGGGGQQQDGPMNRAMNRALQETNRALNDQRDLNDQTEQAQRDGASPQKGQQLADQQRQLRERLSSSNALAAASPASSNNRDRASSRAKAANRVRVNSKDKAASRARDNKARASNRARDKVSRAKASIRVRRRRPNAFSRTASGEWCRTLEETTSRASSRERSPDELRHRMTFVRASTVQIAAADAPNAAMPC